MEDFIGIIVAIVFSVVATVLEKKWPTWKKLFSSEESRREEPRREEYADAPTFSPVTWTTTTTTTTEQKPAPTYVPVAESVESTPMMADEAVTGDVTEPQLATRKEDVTNDTADAERREALRRHYDRWRQAIFDSLIIPPKYND